MLSSTWARYPKPRHAVAAQTLSSPPTSHLAVSLPLPKGPSAWRGLWPGGQPEQWSRGKVWPKATQTACALLSWLSPIPGPRLPKANQPHCPHARLCSRMHGPCLHATGQAGGGGCGASGTKAAPSGRLKAGRGLGWKAASNPTPATRTATLLWSACLPPFKVLQMEQSLVQVMWAGAQAHCRPTTKAEEAVKIKRRWEFLCESCTYERKAYNYILSPSRQAPARRSTRPKESQAACSLAEHERKPK